MVREAALVTDGGVLDFADFFSEQRDRLFRSLFLLCGNRHDAEDLTQEAFARVYEHWHRVGESREVAGYLHRTAVNLFLSRRRRAAVAMRNVILSPAATDDEYSAVETRHDVLTALQSIPPRQRSVIVLVGFLGYSAEEASRCLGIKASTVRVLLARARAMMSEGTNG
jgi:RNA polymerase sigma factor (sigma-70 family)